jgi:hypothetical protein
LGIYVLAKIWFFTVIQQKLKFLIKTRDTAVQPTFFKISSRIIRHTVFNKEIWHRSDMHSGVNDTAVQIWHRCDFGPHIRKAVATFKGNIYQKTYIDKMYCTLSITFTQKLWGLTRDMFFVSAVSLTPLWQKLAILFSLRNRIHIQKGLNRCIRCIGGVDLWKKSEVENLVSGPL